MNPDSLGRAGEENEKGIERRKILLQAKGTVEAVLIGVRSILPNQFIRCYRNTQCHFITILPIRSEEKILTLIDLGYNNCSTFSFFPNLFTSLTGDPMIK
ncbi:hypothetical protein CDAR_374411 [Caerostris darwini]|uniref:Uncharacterized protein n=1 Tax=Caerostris darwini TaxID=1538125 RepID=A0AAV4SNX2_9ARAC|nr:hypothetical protein CDAR_374411 [Caerostris darwini]